ncbi:putative toluene 4-monooxygenase protein B [Mycobacterium kansasii 662]|jgi:toluene monooxygenase system protein B|uniref:Putative toluene 4-monooxygenase protein B n=1 Tax=Mycobacterium kansasii 662 TaxID=1299326 RepID=X7ZNS3_MYCKA|nr:toluene-4-monooxygenase system B family protein [Mycobacterium kansasii]EUA20303.1 putative toluene 4-monooxygenase protein B [Mycobacterium kansasii 662]
MALLPLTALFEGDVLELLIPVDDADSVESVSAAIAHHVVGHRVAPHDAPIRLRHNGNVLDPTAGIGASGVGPLDHVEAFYEQR